MTEKFKQAQLSWFSLPPVVREEIMRRGASMEAKSMLLAAMEDNDVDEIQRILDVFPSIRDDSADNGLSFLQNAAAHEEPDALEVLLAHNCDVNRTDVTKRTALHTACLNGRFQNIKILLNHGADVNAQDCLGYTPLMVAAESGSLPCLQELLDHGADLARENCENANVLHVALALSNTNVVKFLADKMPSGALLEAENCFGDSPLHIAARENLPDCISALIKAGARPDGDGSRPTSVDGTPLQVACRYDSGAACAALLSHLSWKAAFRAVGTTAETAVTPLQIALQRKSSSAVDAILAAGADASLLNEEIRAISEDVQGPVARAMTQELFFTSVQPLSALCRRSIRNSVGREGKNLLGVAEDVNLEDFAKVVRLSSLPIPIKLVLLYGNIRLVMS